MRFFFLSIVWMTVSVGNVFADRPTGLDKIESKQLNMTVYFASTHLLKAKKTLEILKDAFQRQVIEQGFTAPSRYEIYLASTSMSDAYTSQDETGIYTVIDPSIQDLLWPVYIHHEWQHACQYAMKGPSSSLFMDEASAVFQEILAFPKENFWLEGLQDFQSYPQISLLSSSEDLKAIWGIHTKYEYGGALFLLFLEEKYGLGDGKLLRHLWQLGEPWTKAIEEVTQSSMSDLLLQFSLWRIKKGQFYGDRGNLKIRHLLKLSDEPLWIHDREMPYPLGCFFVRYFAKSTPLSLQIDVKSQMSKLEQDKRELGVAFQINKKDQNMATSKTNRFFGATSMVIHLSEQDELSVGVCDLSLPTASEKLSIHPIQIFLHPT